MNKLFNKFLFLYFDKDNKLTFNEPKLVFTDKNSFKKYEITYILIFLLYMFSVGFILDSEKKLFINIIFFISFLPVIISIIYTIIFFTRNTTIPKYRWLLYAYTFLIWIPLYFIYNTSFIFHEYVVYYFFYTFFLYIFFIALPYIEDILLNIKSVLRIVFMILKWTFINLDKHNTKKVVNNMSLDKKIKYKDVNIYLHSLKNKFRFYWILLAIYTTLNLIFGISIYWLYVNYILPFKLDILDYLHALDATSKWLATAFNVVYILVILLIFAFIFFVIAYVFYLYLKIHFFELLLKKVEKSEK